MADSWKLTIYRGGVKHGDQNLDPGKAYMAGRDPSCDIVLPSSIVSREHTRLTVHADDIVIEDANSSNGTYVEGERISSLRFNGVSPISVGEYKLELASNRSFRSIWSERIDTMLTYFGNHPYKFSIPLLLALTFFTVLFLRGPYEAKVKQMRDEYALNNATLVAKSLMSVNENHWQKGIISNFKTEPFDTQPGIDRIYIVNQYAGILAPQSNAYDVLNDVELEQVLAPPGNEIITKNEKGGGKVFYPVTQQDTVLGAVIVHFSPTQNNVGIPLAKFGFIILLLLLLSALVAYFIITMFLRPWRQLSEEADISVSEQKNLFNKKSAYSELQQFKTLFERLLLKVENTTKDETLVASNASSAINSASVVDISSAREMLIEEYGCTCEIDRSSHHIVHYSEMFAQQFEIDESQSMHILDVFKHSESMLAVITKILEDENSALSTTIDNQTFIVTTKSEGEKLKINFELEKHGS